MSVSEFFILTLHGDRLIYCDCIVIGGLLTSSKKRNAQGYSGDVLSYDSVLGGCEPTSSVRRRLMCVF